MKTPAADALLLKEPSAKAGDIHRSHGASAQTSLARLNGPKTPWLGLISLVLALGCVSASCAIVMSANGQAVSQWRIEPSVLIAILSALANIFIGYSLVIGVQITWWRAALRGTTIGNLSDIWNQGSSLWRSFAGLRSPSILMCATILATLAGLENAVLQRSVSSKVGSVLASANITIPVQTEYIIGTTSLNPKLQVDDGNFSAYPLGYVLDLDFSYVLDEYLSNAPIRIQEPVCKGVCNGSVLGVGVHPVCTSRTFSVATEGLFDKNNTQDLFVINTTWISESVYKSPQAFMNVSMLHTEYTADEWPAVLNCTPLTFTFRQTNCTFYAAKVRYPFSSVNGEFSLIGPENVLSSSGRIDENPGGEVGVFLAVSPLLQSTAYVSYLHFRQDQKIYLDINFDGRPPGKLVKGLTRAKDPVFLTNVTCSYESYDPFPFVMSTLNQIMFRWSLYQSQDNYASTNSTVTVVQEIQQAMYLSRYSTLGVAAGLLVVTILCVASTYYGFWELDQKHTLHPFEIARILRAPILVTQNVSGMAPISDVIREVGRTKVKYGELLDYSEAQDYKSGNKSSPRLVLAEAYKVVQHKA